MPIRLNQLRDILQGLGYSASAMESSEPGLSIAMRMHGESRKVGVLPDQSGENLHLRSLVSYCVESRPSLLDVLRATAAFNLRNRTVRLGWEAGEKAILACADLWLIGEASPVRSIEHFLHRFQSELEVCGPVLRGVVLGQSPVALNVPAEIDDDLI
jgi:hypothetical protein